MTSRLGEAYLLGHFLSRVALGHTLRLPRIVIAPSEDAAFALMSALGAPADVDTRLRQLAAGLFDQTNDVWNAALGETALDPDRAIGQWAQSSLEPQAYRAMRLGYAIFAAITLTGAAATDVKARHVAPEVVQRCIDLAITLALDPAALKEVLPETGRSSAAPLLIKENHRILDALGGAHLAHFLERS